MKTKVYRADNLDAAAILAVIAGVLFALGSYLPIRLAGIENPNALYLSLVAGLLFALILFPVVLYAQINRAKKFTRFEKTLTSPILGSADANFRVSPGKVVNGRMYLCRDEIVFASLEKREPLVDRIAWDEINAVTAFRTVNVIVSVKNGRAYCMQTPDFEAIANVFAKHEWNVRSGQNEDPAVGEVSEIEPMYEPKPVLVIKAEKKKFYAIFADGDAAAKLIERLNSESVRVQLHGDGVVKVGTLPWTVGCTEQEGRAQTGDVVIFQENRFGIFCGEEDASFACAARICSSVKDDLADALPDGVTVTLSLEWGE